MVSVTSCASASPAEPRMLEPSSSAVSSLACHVSLPVDLFQVRLLTDGALLPLLQTLRAPACSCSPVPSRSCSAASRDRRRPRASRIAGLTAPPVFSSSACGVGLAAAGDRGDDARGAVAQLDVVGQQIDHVAVMDMAEMDGGQRRQHVERDLLRRAGAHAGRAGDHLRRRGEQDRRHRPVRAAACPHCWRCRWCAAPRRAASSSAPTA